METSALIAPAEALPVAPWTFRLLLDVGFGAHILLVNVMLGLTLLGLVRSLSAREPSPRPAGLIPNATALAVNLAIPPLLFLQALYGQFFYVSSTLMGVYWYCVALAVMAAYGLAYRQKSKLSRAGGRGVLGWALMAALMLAVALAQTNNAELLIRPDLWSGYFDNPTGTLAASRDPSFIPRWLHFVAASLALGGLSLAMAGRKRAAKGDPEGKRLVAEGLAWFAWATLAQAMDGLWLLTSLPEPVRLAFLGGDLTATTLLEAGLALAGTTLALAFMGRMMLGAATALATVGVMVAIRDELRALSLAPYFDPAKTPVRPEYSTMAMFLVALALTLGVIFRAARTPGHATETGST